MNNFDDIPFEQNDNFSDDKKIPTIKDNDEEIEILTDENNIIMIDERVRDIKKEEKNTEPTLDDNNIIIMDPKIKDISPKNSKISFRKPTIIIPVIAFIFVSILGMYLFVSNSHADTTNLIKVVENEKYGYIDADGTVITRAKYIYGSDYYKGHAIVRNENNLYGVLNSKGVLEIPFGNYYYIGLYGDRYIISKQTKEGLKQALLDGSLNNKTSFKYDTISYANDGIYLFTRGETMGVMNSEGKEIYSFKVDEIDNKNIDIDISSVTKDTSLNNRYAKVKVNDSSTIINVGTGKKVFKYTLDKIEVLDNNVFYIKSESKNLNNIYIVIGDDKVKLKTSKYMRVRVDDIDSNIAIGINDDTSISYINLNTQEEINEDKNNDYTYGDGIVLEKKYNFNLNDYKYNIITANGITGSFDRYTPVTGEFSNKKLIVQVSENKYNYINKKGKLINNASYDTTSDFNEYGYAIVSNNGLYGIIDSNGKEIVKLSYENIMFLDDDISKLLNKKGIELFIYQDENKKYGIIDSKGKIQNKAMYEDIDYITDQYPIVEVKYGGEYLLYNLENNKELPIKTTSSNITIKDNYIIVDKSYYNYSGKLIYTLK